MSNQRGKRSDAIRWLSTTDAPANLTFARRRLTELERTHLNKVLSSLRGAFFADDHTLAMIQRNRSYALSCLKELIAPEYITDEAVGAALLLCGQCEKSGREYASHILRTGCDQHRELMLACIAEETSAVPGLPVSGG